MIRRRQNRFTTKKALLGFTLLAVIIVIALLEVFNVTHIFHAQKAASGKIPVTSTSKSKTTPKTAAGKTSSTSTATTKTPDESVKNTGGTPPAAAAGTTGPQAPFGGFVSNHSASLSDSEQSSCITTAGATCTITFTNNSGVVKTLPAQTTDGNGNTSWDWNLNKAGFTAGSWTIKATATLNGQSQSTTDPKSLSVK